MVLSRRRIRDVPKAPRSRRSCPTSCSMSSTRNWNGGDTGSSRWADDFVILLRTERAALRVMEGITRFLEEELGLRVNRDKSRVAPIKDVEFLGFQILRGQIRVSTRARKRFVQEVRSRTRRNNGLSMHQVIGELNEYLEGWVGYYRIQEFRKIFPRARWIHP